MFLARGIWIRSLILSLHIYKVQEVYQCLQVAGSFFEFFVCLNSSTHPPSCSQVVPNPCVPQKTNCVVPAELWQMPFTLEIGTCFVGPSFDAFMCEESIIFFFWYSVPLALSVCLSVSAWTAKVVHAKVFKCT